MIINPTFFEKEGNKEKNTGGSGDRMLCPWGDVHFVFRQMPAF